MRQALLFAVVVGVFVFVVGSGSAHAEEGRQTTLKIGEVAPDFTLTDATGRDWLRSALQSAGGAKKPLLLFVYCTTCAPCRMEEKGFDTFFRSFGNRAVVSALVGSRGETAAKAQAYVNKKGLGFPCLYDTKAEATRLFNPRTTLALLFDAEGVLRYRGPLAQGGEALAEKALVAVLEGKEVAVREAKDPDS